MARWRAFWHRSSSISLDQQHDPVELASLRWWTSRGPRESCKRDEQGKLLVQFATQWGRDVLHIFDQGFASSFWLGLLFAFALRFVLRWKKEYQLVDAQGNRRAAWKIARGKRGGPERTVWDWEPREKLLLLATLAYAFLLTLLSPCFEPVRRFVLRRYGHRTGRHCRQAHAPFARLRMALSRFWQAFGPRWEWLSGRAQPLVTITLA